MRSVPGGTIGTLLIVLMAIIGVATPFTADAHATLLSTTPTDGSVVDTPPRELVLTFNEQVRLVDGGLRLFDPDGNEVALDGASVDQQVVGPLPETMGNGTWTVDWRVVSADGHPISGALTFSVGAPSDTSGVPMPDTAPVLAERLTSVVQGLGYVGLLVAVGLTLFQLLVHRTSGPVAPSHPIVVGASLLGMVAWLALIPLTTLRQLGREVSDLFSPSTWWSQVDRTIVISSMMVAIGLAMVVGGQWMPGARLRRVLELTGVILAVIGPTLNGHTRVFTPAWVFFISNIVHTSVAAVWIGGLIGLLIIWRQHNPSPDDRLGSGYKATILARFSSVAAVAVAFLVPTGIVSGWIVLGAVRPFFDTTYGRLILLKIGLVLVVMAIAAWNRYRLVPRVVAGHLGERDARRFLNRLAGTEAVVLIAVAMVTGFLVNQSPVETGSAADTNSATIAIDEPLGGGSITGSISPAETGVNVVTFQVFDDQGEPLEPYAPPVVRASLPQQDLGPLDGVVEETDAPATFRAEVNLPMVGTWELSVSVRTSRFEEPIARFDVDVPPTGSPQASPGPSHDDHGGHDMDHEAMMGATGTGVVYLSITNAGDEDDALLGGTTSRAERVELHQQNIENDIASMRPIDGALPIPAGETVALSPAALHLMLVNLTEDNRAGDVFDLTLTFERAGEVTLQVPVRLDEEPTSEEPPSQTAEVGDLVIEDTWSRPAPSFASSSMEGTPD